MAHIEPMKGSENVLADMDKAFGNLVRDIDIVAQRCINKADPVMEAAYKGALAGSYAPAAHMTATTPAKRNDLGNYSVSRPVGHKMNKKQVSRYAMLAAFFEHGVPAHTIKNGFGIPGNAIRHPGWPYKKPFHDNAVHAAEGPTTVAVEQAFSEEIDRIMN